MEIYSLLHAVLRICAVLTAFAGVAWIGSKAIVVTDPVHIRMVSILGRRWRILPEGVGLLIPLLESSEQYLWEKQRTEFDKEFNSKSGDPSAAGSPTKIDAVLRILGSVQWIAQKTLKGYCTFMQQTRERIELGLQDAIVSSIAVIAGQHTPEDMIQNLRALILIVRDLLMTKQPIYDNYAEFEKWVRVRQKIKDKDGKDTEIDEPEEKQKKRIELYEDVIKNTHGDDHRSIRPDKRIEFYDKLYSYVDEYVRNIHTKEESRLECEFGISIVEVAFESPQFPKEVKDANALARRVQREQEAQEFAHKEALRRAKEYVDPADGVGNITGEAALDRALLIGKGGAPTVEVKVHDIRGINTALAEALKAMKGGS